MSNYKICNKQKKVQVQVRNWNVIENGNVIADKSNNFFVNVGTNLAQSIPTSSKRPSDYITYNVHDKFVLYPVTENEIGELAISKPLLLDGKGLQ